MTGTADFIAQVETELAENRITEYERKTLLKDMPDIINKMNEKYTNGSDLSIRAFPKVDILEIKDSYYLRLYDIRVTLRVTYEHWYDDKGVGHRDNDKPASIHYALSGDVSEESWVLHGEDDRTGDKPTKVTYQHGRVASQEWAVGEIFHRDGDKPAFITYDTSGSVSVEAWYKRGALHRDGNKPAWVMYSNNGVAGSERYFVNGNEITR